MKIAVVGCGRIGSPLLTWLAYQNVIIPRCFESVIGIDVDKSIINKPISPRFQEAGWLKKLLQIDKAGLPRPIVFDYHTAEHFGAQDVVIITCGTPLDKNLNPDTSQLYSAFLGLHESGLINQDTLIILRSTIFPGGTRWIKSKIETLFSTKLRIVMAPERIVEGHTFDEIEKIPQILGSDDDFLLAEATDFFKKKFGSLSVIPLGPQDGGTVAAELAKLMANSWRYINFATANEFAMLCDENNVNFNAVRNACNKEYPRCNIGKAALNVGGPCLGKDAQILSAYSRNAEITLAAYNTAEKTVTYFLKKYEHDIKGSNVGILGLAFKANSDNPMNSLSYKAIKHLEIIGAKKIYIHDPHVNDKRIMPVDFILKNCSIIFIMTEHDEYRDIDFGDKLVIRL